MKSQKDTDNIKYMKRRLDELNNSLVEGWERPNKFYNLLSNVNYACTLMTKDKVRGDNYHLKIHKTIVNVIKKMFKFHKNNQDKWEDFLDFFDPVEYPKQTTIMFSLNNMYNYYMPDLIDELYNLIKSLVNKEKIRKTKQSVKLDQYSGDLYIVQLREDVITNKSLYKIGMTNRSISERIRGYPKGSVIKMSVNFTNHKNSLKNMESEWIKLCKESPLLRNCNERGNEYFEGAINIIKEKLNIVSL